MELSEHAPEQRQQFVRWAAGTALLVLSIVVAFNLVAERVAGTSLTTGFADTGPLGGGRGERELKVRLLAERDEQLDFVLLGNSRMQRWDPERVRRATGATGHNVGIVGSSILDMATVTRWLAQRADARGQRMPHLVYVLPVESFDLQPRGESTLELPDYRSDASSVARGRGALQRAGRLIELQTLKRSARIMLDEARGTRNDAKPRVQESPTPSFGGASPEPSATTPQPPSATPPINPTQPAANAAPAAPARAPATGAPTPTPTPGTALPPASGAPGGTVLPGAGVPPAVPTPTLTPGTPATPATSAPEPSAEQPAPVDPSELDAPGLESDETLRKDGYLARGAFFSASTFGTLEQLREFVDFQYRLFYGNVKRRGGPARIEPTATKQLERLLSTANRAGDRPTIVLPPMQDSFARELGPLGRDRYVITVREWLEEQQDEHDFLLLDYSEPEQFGDAGDAFYDGVHPRAKLANASVDRVIEDDPLLKPRTTE
jgi:hypothetical protein